jgi:hypothetical protein
MWDYYPCGLELLTGLEMLTWRSNAVATAMMHLYDM